MKPAVIYARVSSRDQEREGYSIPAQRKLLRDYAEKHGFSVLFEFVDVETAKTPGRARFGEMVKFLESNPDKRTILVEKTDRLYRNFRDYLTLEDLEVEIHLVKEGQVLSKAAKSQTKLMHGFQVVMARNFIDNLKEEVRKGMREKAEQGIFPGKAPFGYRNDKLNHTIEIDEKSSPVVRRIFEAYAGGSCSLAEMARVFSKETGRKVYKGSIGKILKNLFYSGSFYWEGRLYPGKHQPIVSEELRLRVQTVFRDHHRPKYGKQQFAFSGLLRCAYDGCGVTAERKKGRYVYYHCSGYRGKCQLPYFREEQLGERLGEVLRGIHIPQDVLAGIEEALLHDDEGRRAASEQRKKDLESQVEGLRNRIEKAYVDKLDGRISEEFWQERDLSWRTREQEILREISAFDRNEPKRILDATRILELAHKAYFQYVRQDPPEKAKLLRIVLSNCAIDCVSLYPTYRKPFDLIFQAARTKGWQAWGDSNSRPTV